MYRLLVGSFSIDLNGSLLFSFVLFDLFDLYAFPFGTNEKHGFPLSHSIHTVFSAFFFDPHSRCR